MDCQICLMFLFCLQFLFLIRYLDQWNLNVYSSNLTTLRNIPEILFTHRKFTIFMYLFIGGRTEKFLSKTCIEVQITKSFAYEFHRFFFVILVYLFIILGGSLGIAQATLLPPCNVLFTEYILMD